MGRPAQSLSEEELAVAAHSGLGEWDFDGRSVLVIIPDATRSGPVSKMFRLICEGLRRRAATLDFLNALGAHRPLSEEQIGVHVGMSTEERKSTFPGVHVFNHCWWDSETFLSLGVIGAGEVGELNGGMLEEEVDVWISCKVVEYEHLIVCGPVFPHEVVGFSGGNKSTSSPG